MRLFELLQDKGIHQAEIGKLEADGMVYTTAYKAHISDMALVDAELQAVMAQLT